jgi:hypothetical protein
VQQQQQQRVVGAVETHLAGCQLRPRLLACYPLRAAPAELSTPSAPVGELPTPATNTHQQCVCVCVLCVCMCVCACVRAYMCACVCARARMIVHACAPRLIVVACSTTITAACGWCCANPPSRLLAAAEIAGVLPTPRAAPAELPTPSAAPAELSTRTHAHTRANVCVRARGGLLLFCAATTAATCGWCCANPPSRLLAAAQIAGVLPTPRAAPAELPTPSAPVGELPARTHSTRCSGCRLAPPCYGSCMWHVLSSRRCSGWVSPQPPSRLIPTPSASARGPWAGA